VTTPDRRLDRAAAWVLDQMEHWRSLLALPLDWLYTATDQQEIIDADVERWADLLWVTERSRMRVRLLYAFPQFRAVYYHRLRQGNAFGGLLGRLAAHLWRPTPGLDLGQTPIGSGLFVSHGEGTILSAERIGNNLQVHQGVTIGWDYRGERRPIVGDDVFIGAGAKVLGAITVGDGAMIGANAVVMCDVPPGATAVGIPARIVPGRG